MWGATAKRKNNFSGTECQLDLLLAICPHTHPPSLQRFWDSHLMRVNITRVSAQLTLCLTLLVQIKLVVNLWHTLNKCDTLKCKDVPGATFHYEFWCFFPQNAHTLHHLYSSIFLEFHSDFFVYQISIL